MHNLSGEPIYIIAVTKRVQAAVGPGQVGVAFEGPAVDDEFSVVGRMCVVVAELQVQGDQGEVVLRVEDETVTATPPWFLELPPDAILLPQAPNFSCPGE